MFRPIAFAISIVLAAGSLLLAGEPLPYTGVNLAGGEFYGPKPGVVPVAGKNFVYPNAQEIDYFVGKGMNIFRVPFRWETLQPEAMKPLDPEAMKLFKDSIELITAKKAVAILDPHNSARYYGQLVGKDLPDEVFADFWMRLGTEFKDNDLVWFGLVNEPTHETRAWLKTANAAIKSIRDAGAKNMILVPGTAWSGAHSWMGDWYGEPNGKVMLEIVDPGENYIIEVHQYLDEDSSGTKPVVVSATIGSERLKAFTEWCRTNKKKALLGEFAVPATDLGKQALEDMLTTMEKDRDVWVGFTWWAAGSWWGDYMFSIQPGKNGEDKPQMAWLMPHLQPQKAQ